MKKKLLLILMVLGALSLNSCKQKQNKKTSENESIKSEKSNGIDSAIETKEGLKLTFSSDLLFSTDSFALTNEAKSELDKLVKLLNRKKNKNIRIDGYTDNTGNEEYNMKLSINRANSVKEYLESVGISASRMTIKGFGQSNPVAENNNAVNRQKNRRVEIIILK